MFTYTITNIVLYYHVQFWNFQVAARISGIESSNDWFYSSCKTRGCNKKLKVSERMNKCFKCLRSWSNGILTYKLRIGVVDIKGNASFLLWDRECMELIEIGATGLYDKHNPVSYLFIMVVYSYHVFKFCTTSPN